MVQTNMQVMREEEIRSLPLGAGAAWLYSRCPILLMHFVLLEQDKLTPVFPFFFYKNM